LFAIFLCSFDPLIVVIYNFIQIILDLRE